MQTILSRQIEEHLGYKTKVRLLPRPQPSKISLIQEQTAIEVDSCRYLHRKCSHRSDPWS